MKIWKRKFSFFFQKAEFRPPQTPRKKKVDAILSNDPRRKSPSLRDGGTNCPAGSRLMIL